MIRYTIRFKELSNRDSFINCIFGILLPKDFNVFTVYCHIFCF